MTPLHRPWRLLAIYLARATLPALASLLAFAGAAAVMSLVALDLPTARDIVCIACGCVVGLVVASLPWRSR